MLLMGTGTQILFPLLAGIVFAIWRRDLIAWGVCWAWAASAMCDGARYIFDAPRGDLMLMGASDGLGDWSKILGPEHVDKLYVADRLAGQVRSVGILTWTVAVGLIGYTLVRDLQRARSASASAVGHMTAKPSGALAPIADVDMWRR
jgi:hypothetical protein